jgi:phosphate-selective porin O/P
VNSAAVLLVVAACVPAAALAQYPLIPSPAMDVAKVSDTPILSGYGAARQTLRADTNTFSVTRARFTMQTQPGRLVSLRLQADFAALDSSTGRTEPSFALTDAYVQLSPPESSVTYSRFKPALLVGQFKTPFSLEFLTTYAELPAANRSQASDSLSTRRDIGMMGQVQAWNRVVVAAAVVNGQGSNNPGNPTGKEMVVGRLTLVPLVNSFAVAGKWLAHGGDRRWGADVRWFSDPHLRRGSIIAEGEWIRRKGAVIPGTTATDGSGGYVLALWRPLPWLEPVVKWERMRESHTTVTTTSERRIRWTTLGVVLRSPEPAEHLRIQVNWIFKREQPERSKNELVTQFIAQF